MLKYFYILLGIGLGMPTYSLAQTEEVQIEVYSFEDGLSHRNVFDIEQDDKGFIWLATFNGLNRFDGIQFESVNYKNSNNSSNTFISDICINENGQIYVLDEEGVISFHPDKVEKIESFKNQKTKASHLFLDSENRLWVNSFSNPMGRSFLHLPESDQKPIPLLGNYPQKPIAEDKEHIYIALKENHLQQIHLEDFSSKIFKIPSNSRITDFKLDRNNQLWILTQKGELFYRKDKKFIRHEISMLIQTNNHAMNTLWIEENGDIWLGGFSNLWHYDISQRKISNFNNRIRQITKNAVNYRKIYQDQQGLIWVASDFGAIKISQSNQLFQNYLHEGSEYCNQGVCSMRGITGNGTDKIYFSYYSSIHELNTKTDEITPLFRSFPFQNAPFGLAYQNDQLYIGNGIHIDLQTMQVDTLFQSKLSDKGIVEIDKDQQIWMGYEQEVYVFDSSNQAVQLPILPFIVDNLRSEITYLYQGDFQDYFWISTNEQGLLRVDVEKGEITPIHTKNSKLSNNRILATYEDKHQQLWIASANGLNQLDIASGDIKVLTTKDGLTNNFINGLLSEGDTCIWVSTDNGLSRYHINNKSFTNYYQQDGLSSNEFNRISFYQTKEGRMYFGGLNGINAFFPSEQFVQEKEKRQAPIVWTSFARFDGKVDSLITQKNRLNTDSTIELTHQDKFFTLEFALADYTNPSQNKYSYMLEGFEPDWSKPSNNTSARYYNIPPGDYSFKLKAASVGENWNDDLLIIPIRIKEAFYNTWWFLISALVLMTILVLGLVRYRIYRIEQGRKKLEKEVQIRTKELEKEKQKSDELLLNILPAETAEELKQYGKAKAKRFESVTVFFSDFKNFSKIAEQMEPEELVAEIDLCFRTFDEIMDMYGLEKIKTIGDAYMCVGGIPTSSKDAANKVVQAALEIQAYMAALALEKQDTNQPFFEARIGIHTGSVVAGIVGIKKFAYDIWGDTVNIAARMEENGEVGKVNISEATYQLVKNQFDCMHRGKIQIKNKGMVDMYFVKGKKEIL